LARPSAASSPDWLELPGGILSEDGVIRVLEPGGADLGRLRDDIVAGRYPKPFILDDGRLRRLYFNLRYVQSAMRVKDPLALDLAYTRKMMAFLLFHENPKRVLLIGLGGGSLAKFCHRHLPRARITAVEIDPTVVAMRGQFGVPIDERLAIVQADAADYLPTAEADTDVLLLDGFDRDGIAPRLGTPDFFAAARRRLRPGGLLAANLAGAEEVWHPHLAMLREAFGGRVILLRVSGGDNHIAFAFADRGYPPNWALLEKTAQGLQRRHGLDYPEFLRRLKRAAYATADYWGIHPLAFPGKPDHNRPRPFVAGKPVPCPARPQPSRARRKPSST
jgi:spermidine synthase